MVCGTDWLLGLVMTPSEDCVLSGIRLPFRSEAQLGPAARAGRCLILIQDHGQIQPLDGAGPDFSGLDEPAESRGADPPLQARGR
jgi:hypothetical protein